MKRIAIMVTLDCHDDVPPQVIDWMAANLLQHAEQEFGNDFDSDFVGGRYERSPLPDDGAAFVDVRPESAWSIRRASNPVEGLPHSP